MGLQLTDVLALDLGNTGGTVAGRELIRQAKEDGYALIAEFPGVALFRTKTAEEIEAEKREAAGMTERRAREEAARQRNLDSIRQDLASRQPRPVGAVR
jgi:hypothetical protein